MATIEAQTAGSRDDWRIVLRRYLIFVAAANPAWEAAHLPLYSIWTTGSVGELAFVVVHCTTGDVLIGTSSLVLALLLIGGAWPASLAAH